MHLSIIIPCYNSESTILRSLNSIISQNINIKYEIVIIDDGSIDNTRLIIEHFINNHKHIDIFYHYQNNSGVSSARNTGFNFSKGDYIALLDSDDIWENNKINTQIDILIRNSKIEFLGTNRNNESHFLINKKIYIYKMNFFLLFTKWWPSTPTIIFKKSILKNTGMYNENLKFAEDGEFYYRVIKYANLYVLNKSFVKTCPEKDTYGDTGLSSNLKSMYNGEIFILKSALYNKDVKLLPFILFYIYITIKYIRRIILKKVLIKIDK